MTKQQFFDDLRARLYSLPKAEVEERIAFYSEMIDDRIEEGLSQDDAILSLGSVDKVAEQIIADIPLSKIVKQKIKPTKAVSPLVVVLLIIGSPIWISLIASLFAVIIAFYAGIWSAVISVWAGTICVGAGILAGLLMSGWCLVFGKTVTGLVCVSATLVLSGLFILFVFMCKKVTKGVLWLGKKILLCIKKCFVR